MIRSSSHPHSHAHAHAHAHTHQLTNYSAAELTEKELLELRPGSHLFTTGKNHGAVGKVLKPVGEWFNRHPTVKLGSIALGSDVAVGGASGALASHVTEKRREKKQQHHFFSATGEFIEGAKKGLWPAMSAAEHGKLIGETVHRAIPATAAVATGGLLAHHMLKKRERERDRKDYGLRTFLNKVHDVKSGVKNIADNAAMFKNMTPKRVKQVAGVAGATLLVPSAILAIKGHNLKKRVNRLENAAISNGFHKDYALPTFAQSMLLGLATPAIIAERMPKKSLKAAVMLGGHGIPAAVGAVGGGIVGAKIGRAHLKHKLKNGIGTISGGYKRRGQKLKRYNAFTTAAEVMAGSAVGAGIATELDQRGQLEHADGPIGEQHFPKNLEELLRHPHIRALLSKGKEKVESILPGSPKTYGAVKEAEQLVKRPGLTRRAIGTVWRAGRAHPFFRGVAAGGVGTALVPPAFRAMRATRQRRQMEAEQFGV